MSVSPLRSLWRPLAIALFAIIALAGSPFQAAALEDGNYIMQCGCPVDWSDGWDGNGTYESTDSLDTIVLVNGDTTLLIHELPIDSASTQDMADTRQASLESSATIDDLEVVFQEGDDEYLETGRTWTSTAGDTMISYQVTQVWEANYMLSLEFITPAASLEDTWDLRESVLIVSQPAFGTTQADDLIDIFGL